MSKKKNSKAKAAVAAYMDTGNATDPMGMYTGNPRSTEDSISDEQYRPDDNSIQNIKTYGEDDPNPVQDADDL